MDFIRQRPVLGIALGLLVGFLAGWLIMGWLIWPVSWTDAGPQDLIPSSQEAYILAVADSYAQRLDVQRAQSAFRVWPDAHLTVCRLARQVPDPGDQQRLEALAAVVTQGTENEGGCARFPAGEPIPEADEGGGGITLLLLCVLVIVLLVILFAIFMILRGRRPGGPTRDVFDYHGEKPTEAPVTAGVMEAAPMPLARFSTTYNRGHDTYDDSFSIENASGDFLGECGVGISESIGADTPKNVTAFEVWLFDKNDIRTVTKVIMTQHAFYDEAIQAKLAPKGEPVLAQENEIVALETAALIINARIVDMEYGTDPAMPPESYLERFTVELSAWAKEGIAGENQDADDMLEF